MPGGTNPHPSRSCYAVIFSSERTEGDRGYEKMTQEMVELASRQPGFIGVESARGEDGHGITVSYWESMESIREWRDHTRHSLARRLGREEWYRRFTVRICKVEREYGFEKE